MELWRMQSTLCWIIYFHTIYIYIYIYKNKQDLELNNPQELICQ